MVNDNWKPIVKLADAISTLISILSRFNLEHCRKIAICSRSSKLKYTIGGKVVSALAAQPNVHWIECHRQLVHRPVLTGMVGRARTCLQRLL